MGGPIDYIKHKGRVVAVLNCEGVWAKVINALRDHTPLSIVRMSDGEEKILSYCKAHRPDAPMHQFNDTWRRKYGVEGITCGAMRQRLESAAKECTYFAPDGGEEFFDAHFPERLPFAEIYFPHRWSRLAKRELLDFAGCVTVVNTDRMVMERMHAGSGAAISWVPLTSWREQDAVAQRCIDDISRLVLVSAGPASKCIIPRIAAQGNKVVLDIGSAAPHWWCIHGEALCPEGKCGAVAKER